LLLLLLLCLHTQGDSSASSTSELLWYNAITALPLLTIITAANGDFYMISASATKGLAAHGSLYFYFLVSGAATIGCLLNYSMFLCTMYTTALTTTIVGVLRGVVTVLLGFMLDTVPFSPVNIAGISLNTAGGVWYTWIKYQEKVAGSGSSGSSKAGVRRSGSSYQRLPTADVNVDGQVGSRPLMQDGSGKLSVRMTNV
jgi:solute carrier family 35 protein